MSELNVTVVRYEDTLEEDFVDPAQYFYTDALGDRVYLHTRSRKKAKEYVDSKHGVGHYAVKSVMKAQVR